MHPVLQPGRVSQGCDGYTGASRYVSGRTGGPHKLLLLVWDRFQLQLSNLEGQNIIC